MESVTKLLGEIARLIINPLIILGFTFATIFLFYNIVRMISKSEGKDSIESKKGVMWGVVGLFIMFSVYGILKLVMASFGIGCPGGIFFCK